LEGGPLKYPQVEDEVLDTTRRERRGRKRETAAERQSILSRGIEGKREKDYFPTERIQNREDTNSNKTR